MSNSNPKMNPFPGLRPFTQEEDYLFFGREEQTLELLARLGSQRFVAVVGASGSGKSSLVRCGLLSELQGGKMLGAGASWEIAVTHPGGNPLALLTDALLDAGLYDRAQENSRENLLATLSRSHFGLVEAVKQAGLAEDTNFLLVVDQFEEIFRFHEAGQTQEEMANEFVSMLLEAAAQKEVPIYAVLTMRSDFIGECGQFEGLAEMVNRGEFLIPRLTREQYKRIIEGPIKVAGGRIAPRLLQRLLNDLGQQTDQLPCLQHALMRTWNIWADKGDHDTLDLDDYQRVGKMTHALSLHADEIYDALATDRQRQLCRGLFQALTVQESESRGIRRPQRLGRLCQILDVSIDELLPIIDSYRQKGVTFLLPGQEVALTDRTILDISHESLMRVWTRLRNWVDEEAQAAGIYLRLSESSALYEQGKAGLYRDPELGIALAWQESQHPNAAWAERYRPGFDAAMAFLSASQQASVAEEQAHEAARQRELEQARQLAEAQKLRLEQQRRAAKRLRKLVAGLIVVAFVAGLACVAAMVARNEASRLAQVAEQEADHARQNEEKATQSAERAERSQKETADALAIVESQKAKAEAAERVAKAAEEAGRKLLYTTDMRLAPFVWRDDRTTAEQLRVLLAKHIPDSKADTEKPDLRSFEWYYYQHLLQSSAAVFTGHDFSVIGGAFTANGQLVTLDQNGQVRRWDLGSQDEDKASRRDLPGGPSAQVRILSPNGRLAALAEGNKVHVFDTSTGKETFQIDSANSQSRYLSFSRDSDRLVIVDNTIRWLSAVSGEVIASVDQKFGSFYSLALSADGLTLAVVGHGSSGRHFSIQRLDATTRAVTPGAKDVVGGGGTLKASALSPDGQRIALGYSLSAGLSVCDTATGRLIAHHRSAHASPLAAIAFSGDGARLATGDSEGTIKIWADAQKLTSKSTALLTLKGHQGAIDSVGFSSDGKQLVSTSVDKTARVWDLENAGAAIRPLERSGVLCNVARFCPNGQLIATAAGSSVRLWDGATGQLVRELSAGDNKVSIYSVAFSPADNRLLAVGYGARAFSGQAGISYVALWDIDAGTELARLPGATDLPDFQVSEYRGAVAALAFSPDGKYLVAGFGTKFYFSSESYPNPLKVWEVATHRLIRRLNGHTGHCVSLDFSRDGTLLASGGRDGRAIIWSTATWKATQTLPNPDRGSDMESQQGRSFVDDVAFAPDGKILAMASRVGNVQLWEVATGKLLQPLKGHSSAVTAVAFSPDGRTLASGSGDQTVRLWNVETGRQLMQLDSGSVELGGAQSLVFSPDGKQLLAGGSRTAFWSAAPIIWNDADRAAAKLRPLLQSGADFPSRIRMLSENLRLHEALAKLDAKDVRVQAALAATRANWHSSQQRWVEAAKEVDRLLAADPTNPEAWLRTPGLLRLATALLHQNRPAVAAMLLQEGGKHRTQDPANARVTGFGIRFDVEEGAVRLKELEPNSPASRSKLLAGDVIMKVDDVEMTKLAISDFPRMLTGKVGTKLRLTVRHPGKTQTEDVDLVAENYRVDAATGELFSPLLAAVEKKLAKDPKDAGLLELRGELAGEESDFARQVAEYTAAIKIIAEQPTEAASAHLRRLYRRRGDAYVGLKQWLKATDDYARVVTDKTKDEALLSNQALALAEVMLAPAKWTVLKPVEAKSELGATLSILPDKSILASGANPLKDHYRVVLTIPKDIDLAAVRLEALTHPSLPGNGPGRNPVGAFSQVSWKVTARSPNRKDPITLEFDSVWADHQIPGFPMTSSGHWNTSVGGEGRDCTAVWSMSKPVSLKTGTTLTFEMQFKEWNDQRENLGHFRLSVSGEPAALDKTRNRFATAKLTDPWQKLAAMYRLQGDRQAIDKLVERRPKLASQIGDLFTEGKDEDKDWQRAVEIYSRGITAQTTDAALLSKRATAHEALKNWDTAAADWARAATGNPDGAKLLAEFARRLAVAGQLPLAKAPFEKSQALYERALAADPDNDLVAPELAQLLWDKHENENPTRWTVLKPTEMKSKGGATLTELDDHSILAGGVNPPSDQYTVQFKISDRTVIQSIRLEVLAHDSLPGHGPGRGTKAGPPAGTFELKRWDVTAKGPGGADQPRSLNFNAVCANYSWNDAHLSLSGEWNITGGSGKDHSAVWNLSEPITLEAGTNLRFQMHFNPLPDWSDQNLGRFRLSASADPAVFEREQKRFAAMKLADPWARLAAAYAVNGRNDEASRYFSKALQQADGYEARKPILETAVRFDEVVAALNKQRPDDPQLQLASARKLAERGKQYLFEKQLAKAQAELEKSRAIFTQLLAKYQEPWTVLTPTKSKSQGGETLTVEKDGSIFVTGPNPNRAVYTLKLRTDLPTLTAIRLETIPDARLPNGGAGRFGNGNFHLSELTAAVESGQAGTKPRPIEFGSAIADFSNDSSYGSAKSIDGNLRTRWDTDPRMKETHWAIFVLKSPARMDGGFLSITLDSGISEWGYSGLGRFRLSATNDADLSRAVVRNDLKDNEVADLSVALAKAHAQQGRLNEAVSLFTEALDLATDRATQAKIIAEAAPLEGVLGKLAERAAVNAQFQAELARHFAERGDATSADAARAKARALFEEKLMKESENTALASDLADLLLLDIRAKWIVLKPTEMKSAGGATLTLQGDGSILSSGKHPERDDYTVTSPTDIKNIEAIALDILPHDSFAGGDGRGTDGQFIITQLEVSSRDRSGRQQPVPLTDAVADFEQSDGTTFYGARNTIDGKKDSIGWGVKPQFKTPHRLVVKPGQPIAASTSALTFVIRQHHFNKDHVLGLLVGRFQLSVSNDPQAFEHERDRLVARKLTDPFAKLAAAYHVIGDRAARDKWLERHPSATAGLGDLYASTQDWEQALAEYNKAITHGNKDARVFAARAEAHEKLEQWELAAADWGNADLHAIDKRERYGNPSFPALERRTFIWSRLQQYEKIVLDCNELLKPERLGDEPWIYIRRGEAYDQLRQWQKARADYDRALKLCSAEERGSFHFYRARHFAVQGQWKQAAEDMQQAYQKPSDFITDSYPRREWWAVRDAALSFALAGDVENYGKAVAECYRKQSAGTPNPDDSKWIVLTMLLFPETITKEYRSRLLELAGKIDAYWQPRLTAAIHFRSGNDKKAAELFDANGGDPHFFFLAAMTHYRLRNQDRAKQLLDEGNAWIGEQRDKEPGAGVPRPISWQDWAFMVALQYEASELIAGPGVGSDKLPERAVGDAQFQAALARHFAERGNAPAAGAARAKACALFAEKLAKEPENTALAAGLLSAYQSAGRTREAIPHLAKASTANPKDTLLSLIVAALQAWFGQEKELTATRQRILAFAKDTKEAMTAERAAKACSILPSTDKGELEAALALGRAGMKLRKVGEVGDWNMLALGMAEYRSGNYAAAEEALLASAAAGPNNPHITGTAAFYRAMSLFRQGKKDEARKLAVSAAAKMKPLPADEQNPLANVTEPPGGGGTQEYLILWLVYKEARTLLKIELSPIEFLEEARNDDVKTLGAEHPTTVATTLKLVDAYVAGGRTRESVPLLSSAFAANPKDTLLSLKVASLQAWFGQHKELAATRQRILAFAKDTNDAGVADVAAKSCSILPTNDKAELEAALALGRTAVKVDKGSQWWDWRLLALGMAEYRSGNDVAAEETLRAAAEAGPNNPRVKGISAFYRAMILFRQGKPNEARKFAIAAAAKMRPLPADEQNPLIGDAYYDDLILWLTYREAMAMIKFDAAPAANWLMRALADHRRGETDPAKKACRKAAEMLKLAGTDATLRPMLRQTVLAVGTDSPEVRELIAAVAGDPPATLNEAITHNPDQAKGYRERGKWYGEHGRWKDAIADYVEVFRLDPNTLDAMNLGILLAYSGEKQRYREHSQAMLSRWASTEKNSEADQTLKTIILIPDYKGDAKQLARLAETAVAGDQAQDWYEWWLVAKALHDLRNGRYADALTACRTSRQRAPESKGEPKVLTALDLVIEAMALQRVGNADQACRTLEQAKPLIESHVPGLDGGDWWTDWLSTHILYSEAVGQVAAKKAEPKK